MGKNMYGKRLLVWLLVSMISVSVLAGCGKGGTKTAGGSGSAEEPKQETEQETAGEVSAGEEQPGNSAVEEQEPAADAGTADKTDGEAQETASGEGTAEQAAEVTLEVVTDKELENLPDDVVIPINYDPSIGADLREDENGNAYTAEDFEHMDDGDSMDGMPTPFVEYMDYESFKADVTIGLDEIRDLPIKTDTADWLLYNDGMYDITCYDEEGNSVSLRKAEGTADISGVYMDFDNVQIVKVNGRYMKFSGMGEEIQVAVWSDGTYTWSIYAEPGVPARTMAAMAASVGP
ncbi:MAG: hypothetical protein Q4D81_06620 [Eubacteriales bacterium]|nr:hypothetical protein [Eubacteriales bacterium]